MIINFNLKRKSFLGNWIFLRSITSCIHFFYQLQNYFLVNLTLHFAFQGVVEFSLSLFFSKLVSYTFLFWLPRYINSSTTLGPSLSADLSTLFDVGGIVGAIVAGTVSDATNMSATTCVVMLVLAVPSVSLILDKIQIFFFSLSVDKIYKCKF